MQHNKPKFNLHSRLAMMLVLIASGCSLIYFIFVVVVANKLEATMLATLVGHELDELITEIIDDPNLKMPKTASMHAYLFSRESITPIPEYLKNLDSNVHNEVKVDDKIYHVAIVDLHNDRIYLSFEVTELHRYRQLLTYLLIGGGLIAVLIITITGVWLTKKFLLPVSDLAREVAALKPNERRISIGEKYKDYEVGIIAQSFDQFMDKMDDFVEREQSFTAAISHELRTPVSVIGTSVDVLEQKGIPDNQASIMNRIKVSVDYMTQVIESLLFFARHYHEKVDFSIPALDLNDVANQVLKQYEGIAKDKGLSLKINSHHNSRVRVLANHVDIVLGNLVRNAINFTDDGEVVISLDKDGFSVSDTGCGLSDIKIAQIKKRCDEQPVFEVSGWGFYLITNICRYYGLKLDIKSTLGKGSTFMIHFPENMIAS